MIRAILKVAFLAPVVIAGLFILAPAQFAAARGWLAGVTTFTPAICAIAPGPCFDARRRNLQAALVKLHDGRTQAEAGLHAIDTEDAKQNALLDANTALQTALRTRASEMIRAGATSLTFQGKTYSRPEAEQQAQLLIREEADFRATIARFASRRTQLTEALTAVVVEDNRISVMLATLAAEKAIVVATGSLEGAQTLLDDAKLTERRANEVTEAVVRSTREMASLPAIAAAPGPVFDFSGWAEGQAGALAPAK